MQEQSDYFEREGSINRCFLDVRYELNDKMGHTKDHGEDLNDGRLDDDIDKECVLR